MTQEENEEFNRIEMESRIKQEYVRDIKIPTREQLMAEVAVLTELVRVLSDRVNELQILNQPTWFINSKHTPPQRTWVELTDEELSILGESFTHPDEGINEVDFGMEIQRILKEKNNG